MTGSDKEKKSVFQRLKNRFRLVVMNDDTLEEKASFSLKPLNVFVFTGLTIILLITLTTLLIAFTPLREYIPGYADVSLQRRVYSLVVKADSLEKAVAARDKYLDNIRNVIEGKIPTEKPEKTDLQTAKFDTIKQLKKSMADSLLREEIESQNPLTLRAGENKSGISSFLFFPPIKGTVTSRFDPLTKHYGLDIVSNKNESIKATLDGSVIISNFTSETGYVIAIQHDNNLISLYKHNSALLKKTGDFVKAGEVIAIIGNSGELSSGPHLHFELWYNGSAIDPLKYVSF
jgi:murein DD-endopeptidase MepM/ murein hydrolase activator NlpD